MDGPAEHEADAAGKTGRTTPARRRFNGRKIVLSAVVLAALGYGLKLAADWVMTGRFLVSTDNAYIEADTSVIASEISGIVAEVLASDNSPVRMGDALVRIADADFRTRLAEAEGAVASQKAALANVEAKIKWQESIIRAAQTAVTTADSDVTRTQADFARYRQLHSNRVASDQRFEAAKNDSEKAAAALSRAKATLEAEEQQLAVAVTQRAQMQALLLQAEAQRNLARINLERTVIRAPFAGVVGNRGVQVGQYVRPGTQMLVVVPIPDVHVVANFKETQLASLKRGQPAVITADAWPGVRIEGHVESFAPASGSRFSLLPPENATGNFTKIVQRVPVRIAIPADNPLSGKLRPGLSVYVAIDSRNDGAGSHADLLVLPPQGRADAANGQSKQ